MAATNDDEEGGGHEGRRVAEQTEKRAAAKKRWPGKMTKGSAVRAMRGTMLGCEHETTCRRQSSYWNNPCWNQKRNGSEPAMAQSWRH